MVLSFGVVPNPLDEEETSQTSQERVNSPPQDNLEDLASEFENLLADAQAMA